MKLIQLNTTNMKVYLCPICKAWQTPLPYDMGKHIFEHYALEVHKKTFTGGQKPRKNNKD